MINPNTFAAAAHPYSHINWLERFLVRRCKWENDDLMQERLNGWQIQNGVWDKEFEKGLAEWEKALNLSEKRYIFAGNDAHGNLNRFRQVRLPMITLWENHHHLFGKVNTRVKPSKSTGVSGVIEALKSGRAVISDGPALEIGIIQNECEYLSGSSVRTSRGGSAYVTYITSSEFGEINQLRILTKDNEKNLTFTYRKLNRLPMCSSWQGRITFPLEGKEYIRAEISTVDFRGQTHRALTNPIWLID